MTSLDQAFIRAYRQRDAKVAAPAGVADKVPLADALKMGPASTPAGASVAPSPERVLAALARPCSRRTDPPAALRRAAPSPEQSHHTLREDEKPASGIFESITDLPTDQGAIPELGTAAPADFRDLFYRIDRSLGTDRPALLEQAVPQPHLTVIGAESIDETGGDAGATTDVLTPRRASPETAGFISSPCAEGAEFHWPSVCDRLMSAAGSQFDEIGDAVLATASSRQKVLGIASCRRGEGATTVLLCLARRLLERGYRAALVDADPLDPQLARQLHVSLQGSRQETPAGELPQPETIVTLIDGRLALLPSYETASHSAGLLDDAAAVTTQGAPAATYDVVLVDLGAVEGLAASGRPSVFRLDHRLDAAVLVQDVRVTTAEHLIDVQQRLEAAGITTIGVVQNCVRE